MEQKKEYKYKVSDFWLFQKTFEKVLHRANIKDMSINQWLIQAVENKLILDKRDDENLVKEKEQKRLKEIDRISRWRQHEEEKKINKDVERLINHDIRVSTEKSRELFHKESCDLCGMTNEVHKEKFGRNIAFCHVLSPPNKLIVKEDAWKTLCNDCRKKSIKVENNELLDYDSYINKAKNPKINYYSNVFGGMGEHF